MTDRTNRKPTAIVVLLVLGGTGMFVGLGILPGHHRLAAARAETVQLQDDFAREDERLATLTALHSKVQALRANAEKFSRRIPADHRLGDFLGDLAVIFERHGLENHIFQPRPAVDAADQPLTAELARELPGLRIQPVLVQCEGSFAAFFASIKDLETKPRLTRIASARVDNAARTDGRLKIEMLVHIFYLPQTGTVADFGAAGAPPRG